MGDRRNEGTGGVEPVDGRRNITRLAHKEPGSSDPDATRDTGRGHEDAISDYFIR